MVYALLTGYCIRLCDFVELHVVLTVDGLA